MEKTTAEAIYHDFTGNFKNSPDYVIEFFNRHLVTFNNIKNFKDPEALRLYIELLYQFLAAKFTKCHYNDIVKKVEEQRPLIDQEIEKLNCKNLKDDWYYGLVSYKAMSEYYLKDYKAAIKNLKELIEYDTKNDSYKNWLNHAKYGQNQWISRTIIIVSIALLLVEFLTKDLIPSPLARMTIVSIALTGILISLGYDYYIKRSAKELK